MTRIQRTVRTVSYAAVLAATVGGVYWFTHRDSAVASATPVTADANGSMAHAGHGGAMTTEGQPVAISPSDAQRIGVTYAVATDGPMQQEIRTVGQVTIDESALRSIATKVDGTVEQLFVDVTGQHVANGQPLLTIYSPMLVSAQDELLLARRLERDVAAADSSERRRATDLVQSARRRLTNWDVTERDIAEIEASGVARKTMTIRAPASGYVLQKNVVAGQKIMAGEALYRVAELGSVWVEGEVFERDLAAIRVGAEVQADFQAIPGDVRTGRLSYVYPTLNAETRTVRVRMVLANKGLALKPGMYATMRIVGAPRAHVLSVPRSAVLSTGERSMVFVRDATGQLSPREVVLGMTTDDRIEVLRGLSANETVVASATFLVDGESNLGTALGGMGNMPGMDMTTPPVKAPPAKTPPAKTPEH